MEGVRGSTGLPILRNSLDLLPDFSDSLVCGGRHRDIAWLAASLTEAPLRDGGILANSFRRYVARCSAAAACLLLPLAAPAANAKDAAVAAVTDSVSVDVVLTGQITARCSIGGGGNIDLGELTGGVQATARFDLGCNVPFDLVFQSASGGIAHATQPEGEGPYAGLRRYRLGVVVPALSPQPMRLRGSFSSEEMTAGATLSSGDAIAAGGGEIRLQTEMAPGRDLLAGKYVDKITIVINPRV